jgi:hypothetical protein
MTLVEYQEAVCTAAFLSGNCTVTYIWLTLRFSKVISGKGSRVWADERQVCRASTETWHSEDEADGYIRERRRASWDCIEKFQFIC